MKVIAAVNRSTYLIEATADEVAKIAGYRFAGSHGDGLRVDVGCQILVSDIYRRLKDLDDSEKRLKEAQAALRALADLLTPLTAVFAAEVDSE